MKEFATYAEAIAHVGEHVFTVQAILAEQYAGEAFQFTPEDAGYITDQVMNGAEAMFYTVDSGDAHLGMVYVLFMPSGDVLRVWACKE